MRRFIVCIVAISVLTSALPVSAAIQYGGTTQQASFAASTTQQVGNLINQVAAGDVSLNGSSTVDTAGIFSGIGRLFAGVNTWLRDNAGIDFFGILKGIGHFFVLTVQFFVDLLRKVL